MDPTLHERRYRMRPCTGTLQLRISCFPPPTSFVSIGTAHSSTNRDYWVRTWSEHHHHHHPPPPTHTLLLCPTCDYSMPAFFRCRHSVYVFGGYTGYDTSPSLADEALNDLWQFDLRRGRWTERSAERRLHRTNFPDAPLGDSAMAAIGDHLYVFGGRDVFTTSSETDFRNSLFEYGRGKPAPCASSLWSGEE